MKLPALQREVRCAELRRHPLPKGSQQERLGFPALMSSSEVPGGVVHELPDDLRETLIASTSALDAWKAITPLARNEFICWIEVAKRAPTRERRIRRTREELEEGQRRPCCWPGCKHRERTGQ
ncbi:MAG: YdeI/OmpD-associated family protein [Egibacteraceae bacterium]